MKKIILGHTHFIKIWKNERNDWLFYIKKKEEMLNNVHRLILFLFVFINYFNLYWRSIMKEMRR